MGTASSRRRVWYAAYGSNLHWPRFRCYLTGGRAPGSRRVHPACADPRPPQAAATTVLPFPLFFSGASPTWGGGVAFIDPGKRDAATRVRLYLITATQFASVVAAEGHRSHVRLPGPAAGTPAAYRVAPGAYGIVVFCGQRQGVPVLTVTGPPAGAGLTPPRPAYLRTIASGLAQTHGLSPHAVADYLGTKPGVAGRYERRDLVAVAEGRLPEAA